MTFNELAPILREMKEHRKADYYKMLYLHSKVITREIRQTSLAKVSEQINTAVPQLSAVNNMLLAYQELDNDK